MATGGAEGKGIQYNFRGVGNWFSSVAHFLARGTSHWDQLAGVTDRGRPAHVEPVISEHAPMRHPAEMVDGSRVEEGGTGLIGCEGVGNMRASAYLHSWM